MKVMPKLVAANYEEINKSMTKKGKEIQGMEQSAGVVGRILLKQR